MERRIFLYTLLGGTSVTALQIRPIATPLQVQHGSTDLVEHQTVPLSFGNLHPDNIPGRRLSRHGHHVQSYIDYATPKFVVYDNSGVLADDFSLQIPDASRIEVHSFDVASDGSLTIAGLALSAEGTGASFIAHLSSGSKSIQLIRTNPFWPWLISVAPDETIWTIGVEGFLDANGHPGSSNPDGHMLRHYASDGRMIFSGYPKKRFPGIPITGYLVATNDRIGWYSPKAGTGVYREFSPDGLLIGEYPGIQAPAEGHSRASSFALTQMGRVYLTFETKNPYNNAMYALDRSSGAWLPLTVPVGLDSVAPLIYGSEGEDLVTSGKDGKSLRFVGPRS